MPDGAWFLGFWTTPGTRFEIALVKPTVVSCFERVEWLWDYYQGQIFRYQPFLPRSSPGKTCLIHNSIPAVAFKIKLDPPTTKAQARQANHSQFTKLRKLHTWPKHCTVPLDLTFHSSHQVEEVYVFNRQKRDSRSCSRWITWPLRVLGGARSMLIASFGTLAFAEKWTKSKCRVFSVGSSRTQWRSCIEKYSLSKRSH